MIARLATPNPAGHPRLIGPLGPLSVVEATAAAAKAAATRRAPPKEAKLLLDRTGRCPLAVGVVGSTLKQVGWLFYSSFRFWGESGSCSWVGLVSTWVVFVFFRVVQGRDPNRGSDQLTGTSGRIGRFSRPHGPDQITSGLKVLESHGSGRVGLGQDVLKSYGSGRVGSGRVGSGRVGSGRVTRF